jgi:hypothetical protein
MFCSAANITKIDLILLLCLVVQWEIKCIFFFFAKPSQRSACPINMKTLQQDITYFMRPLHGTHKANA